MKVVIFAGGIGSRISEESHLKPKPMIEIGGKPILWHIMKIYENQGFNEFVICLGHLKNVIIDYFCKIPVNDSDFTIDLANDSVEVHRRHEDTFKITFVDTGLETMTAGRLKRIENHLDGSDFMLTYGDGLANVDLKKLLEFHKSHGKTATLTAVQPEGRFGGMEIQNDGMVSLFREKPKGDGGWINGGYFVLKNDVFNYLNEDADSLMWEEQPLEDLTKANQLMSFKHNGFWKCLDALRDKVELERLWENEKAGWKTW
ncbi:MAG: glucose-1-phosphate cytidylyltransferase [Bacteroidetes bacterium]|nr:glucose-1-phosphate cytidylyltransferase [Bacteroidota bacterium]